MRIKKCSKCKKRKSVRKFIKNRSHKDGFQNYCKECQKQLAKRYYEDNAEHIKQQTKRYYRDNTESLKQYSKQYSKDNAKWKKQYMKKYCKDNAEQARQREKQWRKDNPEKSRKIRRRRLLNPRNRLSDNISSVIGVSLKGNKNGKHWESIVNFTLEELRLHLESLFRVGMTWNNHSKRGWHIDHIVPISLWKFKSYEDEEFKECWALENLQPLWAEENQLKGNRI